MTPDDAVPAPSDPSPLAGFWMGGFEGADHVNGSGQPLDMAAASGHLDRLDEDHARAARAGLHCVRESIGWRLSENAAGEIDLGRAVLIARSAERHGLQVIWTLMHYGLPPDLSLHDDALIERFARFAGEVARVIGGLASKHGPPVFNPINEISFLAWAATQADLLAPPNNTPGLDGESSLLSGYDVKRRLVRASLAGMAAIRALLPQARFLQVEPVVHVAAPHDRPDLEEQARTVCDWQWQAWDLMSGRVEPECGGHPGALDILGVNHYHSSQWEVGSEQRLHWHTRDPRRRPLRDLLGDVWQRYRRPLLLAETSHVGMGRAAWLHDIAVEVRAARAAQVPVHGICLYPLLDRQDWSHPSHWHRSGLWHVPAHAPTQRIADHEYLAALGEWQRELPHAHVGSNVGSNAGAPPSDVLLVFSHLRWDFVHHRTRQLMSRLARHWQVVFVEEPRELPGPPRLDRISHGPRIDVLVPLVPSDQLHEPGFAPAGHALLQGLLQAWWAAHRLPPPVVWACTPMAWPLARAVGARCTVYDCADELSGFLGAPPSLQAHERQALAQADLVLAAGSALAAPRREQARDRLRLLPNAVDAAFFTAPPAEGWEAEETARLQGAIAGPRLGYVGVIDERFDLDLIAALARARPEWQFVMVGPVVKIDPANLPRAPNLHWLGAQPHRLLPHLMAGWRAGLIPFFADHPATRRANPLKLLEYLAAGLPVVSTHLQEITRLPPGIVRLARDRAAFLAACAACIDENPLERSRRLAHGRGWVAERDWDSTADAVHRMLLETRAAPFRQRREVELVQS